MPNRHGHAKFVYLDLYYLYHKMYNLNGSKPRVWLVKNPILV